MGKCGNCGAKTSSVGKTAMVVVGLGLAAVIGIPLLIVVALASIAAIGSSANDEFSSVSDQIHGTSPEDYQFTGALNHLPATAEFNPTDALHSDAPHTDAQHHEDFTAAQ